MKEKPRYTIDVVKDAKAVDGSVRWTKAEAMREYRKLAAIWLVEDGYEVCVHKDDDMIASTWPQD